MKTLGLDISSSTIGWSVLDENQVLLDYGHIKPIKKAKADKVGMGYTARLSETYKKISELVERQNPDAIAIEDYSKKFSSGRTTANTIIVLATFNETCALACYNTAGIEPVKYSVSTMRRIVGEKFGIRIPGKDDVLPFIASKYDLKLTKTRTGKMRDEHYDESDAIFTALAHIIIIKK